MEERAQRRPRPRRPRKKVCAFCAEKATGIDYKDTAKLKKFVGETGKIALRRATGVCAKHQRELATAIARAGYGPAALCDRLIKNNLKKSQLAKLLVGSFCF